MGGGGVKSEEHHHSLVLPLSAGLGSASGSGAAAAPRPLAAAPRHCRRLSAPAFPSRSPAPAGWRCSTRDTLHRQAVPRLAIFCNDCHTAGDMILPRRSEHYHHPILSVQPPVRLIQLFEQAQTSQNVCPPVTPGMVQQYQPPDRDSRAVEWNNGKKSSYWFPNFNPTSQ